MITVIPIPDYVQSVSVVSNPKLSNEQMSELLSEMAARPDLFKIKFLNLNLHDSDIDLIQTTDPFRFYFIKIRNHYGVWRIQFIRTWPLSSGPMTLAEVFDDLTPEYQEFFAYHLEIFR